MNRPTISAIIPVYNGASVVHRAIESALAQSYSPDEIVVVDDGSGDNTAEVVTRYPVRLVRQTNAGPAAARNHGVRVATGEWLAFLDADDAWLPAKLEAQAKLTGDSSVGMIHCYVRDHYYYGSPPDEVSFPRLWERNCIGTSSVLLRRTVFEQCSGFDEDPAIIAVEDYNLWLKIAATRWRIVTVPEMLCNYCPTANSLTTQIRRFARAELANLAKIARELQIPVEQEETKRVALLSEYGRELLSIRDLAGARAYLSDALRLHPDSRTFIWWLAALSPRVVLDLRRRLRRA